MAGLSKTLGPFAGPLPMLLSGQNPLKGPMSPYTLIKGMQGQRRSAPEIAPNLIDRRI